jgi:hypothetical protein
MRRRPLMRGRGCLEGKMSSTLHRLTCSSLVLMASLLTVTTPTLAGDPGEAAFLAENDVAMARMMTSMEVRPSGDIDRDFVLMMIPHHQGAIDMAKLLLRYGHNEQLRRLAQEIIVTQQQEIVRRLGKAGDPADRAAYRQRWKALTIRSVVKRRCGEALTARLEPTQRAQAPLKGVAYNVQRLVILGSSS